MAPTDHFDTTSRLYVKLHRQQVLLRRFWWIPLVVLVVMLVPAYIITIATPPAYRSDARMWLAGKVDVSEGRIYTEELVNFLGTQADLLRSSAVRERALARVQEQFSNAPALKPVPGTLDVLRGLTGSKAAAQRAEESFPFRIKVTESSKSSLLDLYATGAEPKSTRAFLDALMAAYLNFKRESREKTSDRAATSLRKEVNELATELKQYQEKMYAFQMSNNVVFLQEQGSGAGGYLALLTRQLATLKTELQLLEAIQPDQWVEVKPRPATSTEPPPGEASAQDVLAGLTGPQTDLFRANRQIELLKAKRAELSKALQPMHPKILKLDEDIAAQQKMMDLSRQEVTRQLRNRREALQLEVTNLEKASTEWEGKALETNRKMVDYDRLKQDVQRTQALYDKLLGVISTVDVGKSVDQESVSVLEAASPAIPVRKMIRNMGLAFACAVIMGVALLWILGKLDDRFASSSELAEDVPERVIGQVLDTRLARAEGQMRPEFLSAQRFEFLECFRSIRSALWFMNRNGTRPKTLLIGSSVPEEGKSTVALYLASTMALGGSKVLLIDGDMRRAKLHRHFGVGSSPGLAEILNQEISPEQAIIATSLRNLHFLPAGAPSLEPGELVLRSELPAFLKESYSRFDYIIIDSPPVLAADDAAALAPNVDGVLFVVRGAYTSARMVREALDALRQRRAQVLGVIFNRAVSSPFEYHHYRRYRDEYRWQSNITATAA